jgi:hypothetical protein
MKFQNKYKQSGLTFWGFVWGSALVVCIAYLVIIGIPPYLNNQKLYRALEALSEESRVMTMTRSSLIRSLNRKLNIDTADNIVNMDKTFRVKNIDGNRDLSIDYELVVPLAYNVSLLFDFKNHVIAKPNK